MSEATVGTDLLARLRAAIDETERVANQLHGSRWRTAIVVGTVYDDDAHTTVASRISPWHARFIARHDPASVLRRCAADRKILELHPRCDVHDEPRHHCDVCITCGDGSIWPCETLRALAAGYGIEDVNG